MNIYANIPIGFAGRLHAGIIFWISIVQRRSWLWNWMVLSIMMLTVCDMIREELHF